MSNTTKTKMSDRAQRIASMQAQIADLRDRTIYGADHRALDTAAASCSAALELDGKGWTNRAAIEEEDAYRKIGFVAAEQARRWAARRADTSARGVYMTAVRS